MTLIYIGAIFSGVLWVLTLIGLISLSVMQILAPLLICLGIMVVIWIVMVIFALIFS